MDANPPQALEAIRQVPLIQTPCDHASRHSALQTHDTAHHAKLGAFSKLAYAEAVSHMQYAGLRRACACAFLQGRAWAIMIIKCFLWLQALPAVCDILFDGLHCHDICQGGSECCHHETATRGQSTTTVYMDTAYLILAVASQGLHTGIWESAYDCLACPHLDTRMFSKAWLQHGPCVDQLQVSKPSFSQHMYGAHIAHVCWDTCIFMAIVLTMPQR